MRTKWEQAWVAVCVTLAFVVGGVCAGQDNARDQAKVAISHTFRTGEIIGLHVRNKAGENIGKIDDLVIDMKSGEVCYATLMHGGVAGIRSKLFAIPWQSM